jgi:hypothetical protein
MQPMAGRTTQWRPGWLGLAGLLTACATTPYIAPPSPTGDASWREVVPPGITRYQLAIGDVSSGATPFDRVKPIYPPTLLAECPAPVEIPVLLIVDQAGKVSEVRVADELRADAQRRPFIAAVRTAALQWRFNPLQVEHWAADANGNTHVVDSATRPFSLTYAFRFACHAGKSAVTSSVAVATR